MIGSDDKSEATKTSDLTTSDQEFDSAASFAGLPDILEYIGEFGAELVLFLPFCNWLSKAGLLKSRRIKTYSGMKCFYEDLDLLEIIYKVEKRTYLPPEDRPVFLPIKNEHNFDNIGRSPFHLFPDQRRKFMKLPIVKDLEELRKPLLIIHNKYNDEWGLGPVNFFPIRTLNLMFEVLKNEFTIIYIRHGIESNRSEFSEDHNTILPFEDRTLLACHPEVICFEKLFESHMAHYGDHDINKFKNILYSRCYRFITSQGGGAHHIAQFSGSLLIILHRRGAEENWAYGDGYYGFMAPVPPSRVICKSESELVRALPLLFHMPENEGWITPLTNL